MAKMLMIHADKCTGCRNSELACSMSHEGAFRLQATSVHVYTWEREGFSVPMMCQQCHDENGHLIKFRADDHDMVVFPDGRAMVFGTSDSKRALSLYGKYVGG